MKSPEIQSVIDYFYTCSMRDIANYLNRQTDIRTQENKNENENEN